MDVVDAYFIDDRNSCVTYSPDWTKIDGQQSTDSRMISGTSMVAHKPGASFSISFAGAKIHYHTALLASDAGTLNATMVLDGGSSSIFSAPSNAGDTPSVILYDSGLIVEGTHKLVVTANTVDPRYADYFTIGPNTIAASGGGTTVLVVTEKFPSALTPRPLADFAGSGGAIAHRAQLGVRVEHVRS
ncbi:hypothetical protein B0H13DRAFT_2477101 [Mycena leptocephala]|nr:hypothetical protein B0H13DRAFT_2477101 [Mycena leptocephala]